MQVVMGMRCWPSSHLELLGHTPASLLKQACAGFTTTPASSPQLLHTFTNQELWELARSAGVSWWVCGRYPEG